MADKIFIGKVWDDKYAIAKLQLNGEDIDKLKQHFIASADAKVTILVKQSLKGTKYAEIDTWKPNQNSAPKQHSSPAPVQQKAGLPESNTQYADDLPF